jgi:hypothetical protein
LKIANKRSLVAVVLNATAASDLFTQDVEDTPAAAVHPETRETGKETIEAQAERLFQVPVDLADAIPEDEEAQALVGRVLAGFDRLRIDPAGRLKRWERHCGDAIYLSTAAGLDALTALLEALRAEWAAPQAKKS